MAPLKAKRRTGTTDMISDCRDAGLPEPEFRQSGPHFVTTIWRDWLTDDVLVGLGLNERQMKGVSYLKRKEQLSSAEYQGITDCPPRTATRDLKGLVDTGVVELSGHGRGAQYRLLKKRAENAPNAPREENE